MMTLLLYDYVFPIVKRGWQAKCKQSDVTIQDSDWLLRMLFDWLITKFASVVSTANEITTDKGPTMTEGSWALVTETDYHAFECTENH